MQSVLDTILYYLTKQLVLVNHPAVPLIRKCHVTFDDTITAWPDIGGSNGGGGGFRGVATPPPLLTFQK